MAWGNYNQTEHYQHEFGTGASLTPLRPKIHRGMTAIAVIATISFLASTTLFVYITFKLIIWRLFTQACKHNRSTQQGLDASTPQENQLRFRESQLDLKEPEQAQLPPPSHTRNKTTDFVLGIDGIFTQNAETEQQSHSQSQPSREETLSLTNSPPNQFLLLIYNLFLADMHQSVAFALDASWLIRDGIMADTAECWAQGLLVSLGDLASSVWVTAIAVHTYLSIVRGYRPPQKVLYIVIVCLWAFIYLMSTIPILATRNGASGGGFFVPSGAWCWISSEYQALRIATHYAWLFLGLITTPITYGAIFVHVRRRMCAEKRRGTSGTESKLAKADRSPIFLIYPIIYVSCTLPVAVARISKMRGMHVPISCFATTGALLALNGLLDCLLFSFTRHSIVYASTSEIGLSDTGLNTFTFLKTPKTREFGNIVWIQGGRKRKQDERGLGGWRPWHRLAGRPDETGDPKDDVSRSVSQESLRGQAIQMDMVTSVVVEQNGDSDRAPSHDASRTGTSISTDKSSP